jgi:hypothetical protein
MTRVERGTWTRVQIEDFRMWHEKRMQTLNYPNDLQNELRNSREVWMPKQEMEPSSALIRE